jgi:hypothetical protein
LITLCEHGVDADAGAAVPAASASPLATTTTRDATTTASERGLCGRGGSCMRHPERKVSVRGSLPICGEFLIIAL